MPTGPNDKITAIGKKLTALEKPETIKRMIQGLAIFCVLLFIGDFFHLRHGKFESEDLFGFYGFFRLCRICLHHLRHQGSEIHHRTEGRLLRAQRG